MKEVESLELALRKVVQEADWLATELQIRVHRMEMNCYTLEDWGNIYQSLVDIRDAAAKSLE